MPNNPKPKSEFAKTAKSAEPGWEAHNLRQLRYFRSLTLRQKLEAVEGMADVVRRFQQMRVEGKFKKASKT